MNRDRLALSQILERVERAVEFAGVDKKNFMDSALIQDAVIRQLEVIGEATKRVSAATRALSPDVPWKGMAGFKDVVIHQYDAVNLERVWQIVREALPGVAARVRKVFAKLPDA